MGKGYSTTVEEGLAFGKKEALCNLFWYVFLWKVLLWNASLLLEERYDDLGHCGINYCIGPFPDTAST